MRRLAVLICALGGAFGCGATGPDTRRIVGTIEDNPGMRTIEAPDTVRLGVAFTATVYSFGSGCTTADGVQLTLTPAEARVIPIDRIPADDDVVCPAVLAWIPHPVELHFTAPGPATIVAEGRIYSGTGQPRRGTVTKPVVVLP